MSNKISGPARGGCPKCGNMEIDVPDDWTDQTIITCPKCKFEAPHHKFFPSDED
jgi:predicted RNA-binding Zn-ribbon protein involved in translation (DUF1610 family)